MAEWLDAPDSNCDFSTSARCHIKSRNGRGEGNACPRGSPDLEPFAPKTAQQQTLGITARELEILTLVARGFSNREIATQLFVSENTVKTHCARAFDKLGAARRTQAVQRGKELGLLP